MMCGEMGSTVTQVYAKVSLNVGGIYTQPIDALENLVEEIKAGVVGEIWTIELIEMTEREFGALPEFEGH